MPKPRVISFQVPRCALELCRFAGTDQSRLNLQYIHFETDGSRKDHKAGVRMHAIVTDGHRMVHLQWVVDNALPGPVRIRAAPVRDYLKTFGKKPTKASGLNDHAFMLTRHEKNWVLSGAPSGTAIVYEGEDVNYPDWRLIEPAAYEGNQEVPHRFGANIQYLADFSKYLIAGGLPGSAEFHYSDPTSTGPILLRPMGKGDEIGMNVECEYILMPVRG